VNFDISRQAISKHLEVLEAARLITVRREGRETQLFLNRAPMRVAHSLWIEKFIRVSVRVDCS
jgi:DNA-binding transcriptional ArsR family regulator